MSRVSSDLQNIVLKLRMVPVDSVFNRFPRMVRDLGQSLDKKIDLVITGADTELDRTVIDEIGDPLVHLLRNSLDHGIEPSPNGLQPANQKPVRFICVRFTAATMSLLKSKKTDAVSTVKVKQIAIKNGIVSADEANRLTDSEVASMSFLPQASVRQIKFLISRAEE